MAGTINVTPEELKKSAENVDGMVKDYVQLYKNLYNEVRTMKSSWTGEANQRYTQQIEGFESEFVNLQKVLEGYTFFLKEAARVYGETETSIKDNAGKLATGR